MTADKFRAYQVELGRKTHAEMAELLGVSEVSVKRYATGHSIPPQVAKLVRALVLLNRLRKLQMLSSMQ